MIPRAAALAALAATAPATHPPAGYVQQGTRTDGRIEVLLLDEGGRAIGLVARKRRAGGLDLERGYWFSCRRWQTRNDRLIMNARLQESYRYAAPPGAGAMHERVLTMSGNPLRIASLGMELREGAQRYVMTKAPLIDAQTSRRLRFTCDEHDRNAAKH
ncbi:hypothetical protein ACSBM8_18875 [Sphingomonas sp. ASY06-1R]|uniref:hypothetical protein n=1 Tax=Sphingomonas sp. ASY06-1R TaxID=3445771 RepID=UPI003FA242DA